VKEDRVGRDLQLEIQVVRMPDCSPVTGAIVEIWHCDAEGNYSGYPEEMGHDLWKTLMLAGTGGDHVPPTNESRYLRGAQISDAEGKVRFDTILPGWYEPRIPHIHFKIISEENELLTSQFYFDPDFMDRIYTSVAPYTRFGPSLYRPENDVVIGAMPDVAGLQLMPRGSEKTPLRASAKIGIAAPA
jgi:protocatechuate 3,4-dioxygenase beta subunit